MLKIWLVKFSNGEEWHVFGEELVIWDQCYRYIIDSGIETFHTTYLRWVKA